MDGFLVSPIVRQTARGSKPIRGPPIEDPAEVPKAAGEDTRGNIPTGSDTATPEAKRARPGTRDQGRLAEGASLGRMTGREWTDLTNTVGLVQPSQHRDAYRIRARRQSKGDIGREKGKNRGAPGISRRQGLDPAPGRPE